MNEECPLGGLTSFPLGINFEVSKDIYDTLPRDAEAIQVQFGTRTTPPRFMTGTENGGRIDESDGTTTIRYNTNVYTLRTLQICKATHHRWVLPDDIDYISRMYQNDNGYYDNTLNTLMKEGKYDNTEDIVFIFESQAEIQNKVIMIVIPIIHTNDHLDMPLYLAELLNDKLLTSMDYNSTGISNSRHSLESCLPLRAKYIKYMSCIQGYSDQAPVSNIVVFVCVNGINVYKAMMDTIRFNGGFLNEFPNIVSHFMEKFTGSRNVNTEELGRVVSITSPFTKYIEPKEQGERDNLADYQCMPLDMAQIDVKNMSGAKPLTDVLSIGGEETRMLNPGTIEKVVSIVLGVIMGIMFVGLGIYMVMQTIGIFKGGKPTVGPLGVSGPAAPSMLSSLYAVWPFIFVGVIGIAIGAVITIVVGNG